MTAETIVTDTKGKAQLKLTATGEGNVIKVAGINGREGVSRCVPGVEELETIKSEERNYIGSRKEKADESI